MNLIGKIKYGLIGLIIVLGLVIATRSAATEVVQQHTIVIRAITSCGEVSMYIVTQNNKLVAFFSQKALETQPKTRKYMKLLLSLKHKVIAIEYNKFVRNKVSCDMQV